MLEPKMKPHLDLETRVRDMSVRRLKFEDFRNCPKGKNLAAEIEELLGRPIVVGKSSFFEALLGLGGMGVGGVDVGVKAIEDNREGAEEQKEIVVDECDEIQNANNENDESDHIHKGKDFAGEKKEEEEEKKKRKKGKDKEEKGNDDLSISEKVAAKASQLEDIAMEKYSYYMCAVCSEPYFGGESACEAALAEDDEDEEDDDDEDGGGGGGGGALRDGRDNSAVIVLQLTETSSVRSGRHAPRHRAHGEQQIDGDANRNGEDNLQEAAKAAQHVCGSCRAKRSRGTSKAECPDHGTSMIEYKCRFCCSVATWYCWGTTHFCTECHTKQMNGTYVSRMSKDELPKCPGPELCPLGG